MSGGLFLLFICFFVSEACLQAVIYASPVFLHLTSCPGGLAACQTVVLMVYCQLNFTLKKNSPSAKVGSQDARHFLFLEKKNNTQDMVIRLAPRYFQNFCPKLLILKHRIEPEPREQQVNEHHSHPAVDRLPPHHGKPPVVKTNFFEFFINIYLEHKALSLSLLSFCRKSNFS